MNQQPLILVVDDEAYFREIFSEKLQALTFRVDIAEDAESALQKARTIHPDLILMDVRMPGMDGIQAVRKLKDDPATRNIKVVFLTNLGETQAAMQEIDKKFSVDVGAIGYIKKSEDLDEMVQQIKSFLP